MAAPDPKTDQGSTTRSDLSTKSDATRSTPDAATAAPDTAAPDSAASGDRATKDDGTATTKGAKDKASTQTSAKDTAGDDGTPAAGDGGADGEQKIETVACPSCAAGDKPAEVVPYPDDGPNEFKKGTAFCEREGKRVRIEGAPDEEAAVASSEAPTV